MGRHALTSKGRSVDLRTYFAWVVTLLLGGILAFAIFWNVSSCGQPRGRGETHCPGCLQHYHAP
jgi:hypothetical protein